MKKLTLLVLLGLALSACKVEVSVEDEPEQQVPDTADPKPVDQMTTEEFNQEYLPPSVPPLATISIIKPR